MAAPHVTTNIRYRCRDKKVTQRISPYIIRAMLVLLPGFCLAASLECLPYEPAKVTLVGSIVTRDAYGPPGYGEDPKRDEKRRNIILRLEEPICVVSNTKDALNEPEYGVVEVQLALNGDEVFQRYQRLHAYVGTKTLFSVHGGLYHSHTGYHVRKVLLYTDGIGLAKGRQKE